MISPGGSAFYHWGFQKSSEKMKRMIIKEIIEENSPELRGVDFQIEGSL